MAGDCLRQLRLHLLPNTAVRRCADARAPQGAKSLHGKRWKVLLRQGSEAGMAKVVPRARFLALLLGPHGHVGFVGHGGLVLSLDACAGLAIIVHAVGGVDSVVA